MDLQLCYQPMTLSLFQGAALDKVAGFLQEKVDWKTSWAGCQAPRAWETPGGRSELR
jgi:hypothetical protein